MKAAHKEGEMTVAELILTMIRACNGNIDDCVVCAGGSVEGYEVKDAVVTATDPATRKVTEIMI